MNIVGWLLHRKPCEIRKKNTLATIKSDSFKNVFFKFRAVFDATNQQCAHFFITLLTMNHQLLMGTLLERAKQWHNNW